MRKGGTNWEMIKMSLIGSSGSCSFHSPKENHDQQARPPTVVLARPNVLAPGTLDGGNSTVETVVTPAQVWVGAFYPIPFRSTTFSPLPQRPHWQAHLSLTHAKRSSWHIWDPRSVVKLFGRVSSSSHYPPARSPPPSLTGP